MESPVVDAVESKRNCFVCDDRSLRPNVIAAHVKCHDPTGRPFKCAMCVEWYFKTKEALKYHNHAYFHNKPDEKNPNERRKEREQIRRAKYRKEKEEDKEVEAKRVKHEALQAIVAGSSRITPKSEPVEKTNDEPITR